MELFLAVAALVVACAGLAVACLALRAARRPALQRPVPEPRADATQAASEPASAAAELAAARAIEVAESVRRRLDLHEQRVVTARTPPEAPYPADAAGRVRARMLDQGFDDIAVVPADASGRAFTVEGRRGGMTSKGRAVLDDGGEVTIAFARATKVFP